MYAVRERGARGALSAWGVRTLRAPLRGAGVWAARTGGVAPVVATCAPPPAMNVQAFGLKSVRSLAACAYACAVVCGIVLPLGGCASSHQASLGMAASVPVVVPTAETLPA